MKKILLVLLTLFTLFAVPAFASDVAPEGGELSIAALAPAITYKGFFIFDGFTSQGMQFESGYSPVTTVFAGNELNGHVQWEMTYKGQKDGARKYLMKIINSAGDVAYKTSVEYVTYVGEYGARWQAFSIPTGDLDPGYYTMSMTVIIKAPGKDPVKKTVTSKFRVL